MEIDFYLMFVADEFHKFLREIKLKECLRTNMRVVYDLLGSHGDRESLTLVAEILNDYPSVVQVKDKRIFIC